MQQYRFIDLQDQLNMFRAIFSHLQDRKTEIFTAYGIVSCCWVGRGPASGYVALCVRYEGSCLTESSWFLYITLPTLMMHGQTQIKTKITLNFI